MDANYQIEAAQWGEGAANHMLAARALVAGLDFKGFDVALRAITGRRERTSRSQRRAIFACVSGVGGAEWIGRIERADQLNTSAFNTAELDLIKSLRANREHVLEAPIRATVAHMIFRAFKIDIPASHLSNCTQTLDQVRARNLREVVGSGPDYEKMILDADADSSWWT
jgi:hypothetical protein